MREDIFVHEPFLKELENIGWNDKSNGCEVIRLDRLHQEPEQSYRESFSDVVMKSKLRESLLKINDFLEEDQIEECITRLTSYSSNGLITNNSKIFELPLSANNFNDIGSPATSLKLHAAAIRPPIIDRGIIFFFTLATLVEKIPTNISFEFVFSVFLSFIANISITILLIVISYINASEYNTTH